MMERLFFGTETNANDPARFLVSIRRFGWVVVVSIALISGFAIYKIRDYVEAARLVDRQHQFQTSMEALLSGLQEAENVRTAAIFTNSPELYKPYYEAKAKSLRNLSKVNSLQTTDEVERHMLDTIGDLLNERFMQLENVTRRDSGQAMPTEGQKQEIIKGILLSRELRQRITDAIDYGDRRLGSQLTTSRQSALETTTLIVFFSLITLALVVLSLRGIYLTLKRRAQTEMALKFSEEMLRQAEKVSNSGSFTFTVPEEEINWSEGVYQIYGLNPKTPTPTFADFLQMVHPDDRTMLTKSVEQSRKEKRGFEFNYRLFRRSDGALRIFSVAAQPHFDQHTGEVALFYGSIKDVTEEVERNTQLIQLNNLMKRSNEELEQFAYVASHDLQEPLRKIIAFSERFKRKFADQPEVANNEYVERMNGAARRMQNMINNLLSYSQMGRLRAELTRVDLNQVVGEVFDLLEERIEVVKASIKADSLPVVAGNALQLARLFQNLLSNALKFIDPARTPNIRITAGIQDGRFLINRWQAEEASPDTTYHIITVSDNGIGFDNRHARAIFSMFNRLHGRSAFEGTGIGLATCKRIMNNHGGYIFAESEVGKGSSFYLAFPAKDLPSEGRGNVKGTTAQKHKAFTS